MTYIKDNTTFYKMKVIERQEQKSSVFDEFRKWRNLILQEVHSRRFNKILYLLFDKCDKMNSDTNIIQLGTCKRFRPRPVRDRPWEIETIDIKELDFL